MNARRHSARTVVLILTLALLSSGCGPGGSTGRDGKPVSKNGSSPAASTYQIDLPQADAKTGTAIVLLVDTSGSMAQQVSAGGGKQRPKSQMAREALERIIAHTAAWKKTHPDRDIDLGIYSFSSGVHPVLPIGKFDEAAAKAALKSIPQASGGTAIGRALEEGVKALYHSGRARKFVVCITDGENTSGPGPDWVAKGIHGQTKGEVEMQFVAFDVAAAPFKFLKEVNGDVVHAADGEQLQAELTKIYDQRILLEKEEPQPK